MYLSPTDTENLSDKNICKKATAKGNVLEKNSAGVDFIKVGRMAQIIEMALLKLGARRKGHSTPLKSFSKVGRRAQKSI